MVLFDASGRTFLGTEAGGQITTRKRANPVTLRPAFWCRRQQCAVTSQGRSRLRRGRKRAALLSWSYDGWWRSLPTSQRISKRFFEDQDFRGPSGSAVLTSRRCFRGHQRTTYWESHCFPPLMAQTWTCRKCGPKMWPCRSQI